MMDGRRILMVDDKSDLSDALSGDLEIHGYLVLHASDATQAVTKVRAILPDLVVLALLTQHMDGLTVLRQIRSQSAVPVIMLSVRGGEDAMVDALHLGADDYLTTPVSPRELLARIESALRRAAQPAAVPPDTLVVDADLTIDFARNRVIRRGSAEALTATEHRLLYHLVTNAGRLMPFEALLTRVWGPECRAEEHYVRLYVSYLRAKIEPDAAHPKYILTEKGLGYRFADLTAHMPVAEDGMRKRREWSTSAAEESLLAAAGRTRPS